MPFVLALVFGVLAGLAVGGRFRFLSKTNIRGEALMLVLAAAQVSLPRLLGLGLPPHPMVVAWVGLSLIMAALAASNTSSHRGFALVTIGMLLNAAVVAQNGSMPVLASVPGVLSSSSPPAAADFHTLMSESTRLPLLADVMLLPIGATRFLLSLGDVLMLVGVSVVVVEAMQDRNAGAVRG